MTSASPVSSSLKSTASLLAFLAGRPGRRPVGALAADLVAGAVLAAVLRAVVLLAASAVPAAVFRAVVLAAVFLTAAVLAAVLAGAFSAFVLSPTFSAVLAVLLLAATVFVFFAASSAVRGVLPVTWVIVASVNANTLGRHAPTSVAGAELTHRKVLAYCMNNADAAQAAQMKESLTYLFIYRCRAKGG